MADSLDRKGRNFSKSGREPAIRRRFPLGRPGAAWALALGGGVAALLGGTNPGLLVAALTLLAAADLKGPGEGET